MIDTKELKRLIEETTARIKRAKDNVEINTIAENLVKTVMDTEYASLWTFDRKSATLVRERNDNTTNVISMLGQQGVLAQCFFTLSSGIYNYLASEKGYLPEVDNPDNIKIKSKIIVPIIDGEHFLGMVTAYSSVLKIKNFTQDDLEILEALVPFLIHVIYTMHPELKKETAEEVYVSERLLKKESKNVVEKVAEINKEKEETKETENSDAVVSFLANTVHDIRTPANTLYGFLELLEDQLQDERLLQYIQNAKESAHFINDLTTSILDRISSQRERNKALPVALNPTKFFADIAETFSANMSNKEITYNIYIDPFLPKEITIEPVMLKRVLMNLLNNAYKFTPAKKQVTFSVQYDTQNSSMKISVADTGIGIAKEKQEEIFEAFTQAEENTYQQYGGTGLGLSISADYVRTLGGKLKLKSVLEEGSNFYFSLPLETNNPTPMYPMINGASLRIGIFLGKKNINSSKNIVRYLLRMGITKEQISILKNPKDISGNISHLICYQKHLSDDIVSISKEKKIPLLVVEESFLSLLGNKKNIGTIISQYGYYGHALHKFISSSKPMRILVADDDKINVSLIKAILGEEFCKVDTVMNGKEALKMMEDAAAEDYPYALVYLDRHMPVLSGTEVIKHYRDYEKAHGIKRVFAVSISGDENKENSGGNLFDMYVGKPFNKKAIKETLELSKVI